MTLPTPRPVSTAERLARGLGWFSLALGVAGIVAPGRIGRALGLKGDSEAKVRIAMGAVIGIAMLDILVAKSMPSGSDAERDGSDVPLSGEQVTGKLELPADALAAIPAPPSYAPA